MLQVNEFDLVDFALNLLAVCATFVEELNIHLLHFDHPRLRESGGKRLMVNRLVFIHPYLDFNELAFLVVRLTKDFKVLQF